VAYAFSIAAVWRTLCCLFNGFDFDFDLVMPEGRVREEGVAVVELDVFLDLGVSEGAGAGFRDLSRSMEGEAARRAAREWIVAAGGVLGGADE
jgi:hypothetical protein